MRGTHTKNKERESVCVFVCVWREWGKGGLAGGGCPTFRKAGRETCRTFGVVETTEGGGDFSGVGGRVKGRERGRDECACWRKAGWGGPVPHETY